MVYRDTKNWYILEGSCVTDIAQEYAPQVFTNLNKDPDFRIFYTAPEVKLYNPTDPINGVVYKVVKFRELKSIYSNLFEVDRDYNGFVADINKLDKTVQTAVNNNSAQYYMEPFALTESSVVFYADGEASTFDHTLIVFVDQTATEPIVSISASYNGPAVPVDEAFDINYLTVTGHFRDGNEAIIWYGGDIPAVTNAPSITFKPNYLTLGKGSPVFRIQGKGFKTGSSVTPTTDWFTLTDSNPNTDEQFDISSVASLESLNARELELKLNGIVRRQTNITISMLPDAYATGVLPTNATNSISINIPSSVTVGTGYSITPVDRTIHSSGSNTFTVKYITEDSDELTATVYVPGIKKLIRIEAIYDGPNIAYGKSIKRRYCTVVAYFSDGSSQVVSDYSFPEGDIVSATNVSKFRVYYKGYECYLAGLKAFDLVPANLIAYYTGGSVEVGKEFLQDKCRIKIYYTSTTTSDSIYEDVDYKECSFLPVTVDHEGINYILVKKSFGEKGDLTTKMPVIGIVPDVQLTEITAEYFGPDIVVGKSFSTAYMTVKAYYSDGTVSIVKNFVTNANKIEHVGINTITVSYSERNGVRKQTTCLITGIAPEDTTESNFNEIQIKNKYPEATRLNNRYRGPSESKKHQDMNKMLFDNLTELYKIYNDLEKQFKTLDTIINNSNNIKHPILNAVDKSRYYINLWDTDTRFSTGAYISSAKGDTNE